MENNFEQKTNLLQIALKYALILSMATIAISLIGFITNTTTSYAWLWSLTNYTIIVICVTFAMKARKDELLNGYIQYGQALGTGTLVALFAGILMGAWQLVYQKFIDPEFFERIITETKKRMIEQETAEDKIDITIAAMQKMRNPAVIYFSSAFGILFVGFIFSLIIAIFVKKNDPSTTYTE
ncbi:MAG: DUF4199 domain-containing protein [Bacteroidia bacterium]